MRWTVHGERALYRSDWVDLTLVDVELPDGQRLDHHVIRMPREASGTVVHDRAWGVLVLWRHRFVTDTWGWEIPAGRVDPGETPEDAARRETEEESGWRPGPLRRLTTYHPSNGVSDQRFHVFLADGAVEIGPPSDPNEAARVEWMDLSSLEARVRGGEIGDGLSLTALLWFLAFEARC